MAVLDIDSAAFEKEVIGSDLPVMVDFWATWCGPCRMLAPFVEQIAVQYDGRCKFCRVNVDDAPDLARRYSIMNIPTLLLFKNGEPVDKSIGFHPKAQLAEWLEGQL